MERGWNRPDPRACLLFFCLGILSILAIHSETGLACAFILCLAMQFPCGKAGRIPGYIVFYLVLLGFSFAGVWLMARPALFSLGTAISNMGILGRRALIPISYIFVLADMPTGALLEALRRLRLPKAAGIALAVVLRFFPTLGEEYRAIRSAQKFRGVGLGFFHTLAHLPSTIEYILIPLIIRTTKIADELSASVTVRGVRYSGGVISYRQVRFGTKDALLCMAYAALTGLLLVLEKTVLGGAL